MERTLEHLRLLAIANYIVGGLTYLIALFPIFHLAMGIFLLWIPEEEFKDSQTVSAEIIETSAGEEASAPRSAEENTLSDEHAFLIMKLMGGLFAGFAGLFILAGFTLATLMILAGRCLARRRNYTFCFAIAVIECATFSPLQGTVGALTIVVLMQNGTRALFEDQEKQGEEDKLDS